MKQKVKERGSRIVSGSKVVMSGRGENVRISSVVFRAGLRLAVGGDRPILGAEGMWPAAARHLSSPRAATASAAATCCARAPAERHPPPTATALLRTRHPSCIARYLARIYKICDEMRYSSSTYPGKMPTIPCGLGLYAINPLYMRLLQCSSSFRYCQLSCC